MSLEKITHFLEKEGWNKINSDDKIARYNPKPGLGLKSSYVLEIPLDNRKKGFKKKITEISETLSEIYGERPEKLFFDVGNYLDVLKQDAIYFKLTSTEVMHGHTIELDNIWKFLKNLSTSHSNYIKVKFAKQFETFFEGDAQKIRSAANRMVELSRLRLVDLEFQSFSFGVASDVLMGNEIIDIKEVREWRKSILNNYKKEVIELDYSSESDIKSTIEKFSEEERRSIFNPIIQNINRDDFQIHLTNSNFASQTVFNKIPLSTLNVIVPSPKKEEETKSIKLMQVVVPYDSSKSKITLKTKVVENDLFSRPIDEYTIPVKQIIYEEKEILFKSPINFLVQKSEATDEFSIIFSRLNITKKTDDFNKIQEEIFEVLNQNIGYYYYLKERKKKKEVLSKDQLVVIKFFDKIIPRE